MNNQIKKLNEIDSNNNELTEKCENKSMSMSISIADNNKKVLTSNVGLSSSSTVSSMSSYTGLKSQEKENHFERQCFEVEEHQEKKLIKYGELVVLG